MIQKILVVDDKQKNIFALQKALNKIDAEVITAMSGNEALNFVLEHDFAVILMDVQMPEMDGFETAELIRLNPDTSHIPIIFLTALSREDHHVFKGYKSGGVDYMFKPINLHILLSKIRVFMELAQQRQSLEEANKNLNKINTELQEALAKVKLLSGFLPICASCKNIRDDQGYWQQIERYIHDHSEAIFSHGICPQCAQKLYPDLDIYDAIEK